MNEMTSKEEDIKMNKEIIRKYLVIDRKKHGDEFLTVCDTLEEANKEASFQWGHLTPREKKERHIYVAHVENTAEYLHDWAFDEEDGKVDFGAFHSTDCEKGYFDSTQEKEEKEK